MKLSNLRGKGGSAMEVGCLTATRGQIRFLVFTLT
jgi:hypothetical protein